jgi:hypothetical protein
MLKPRQNRNSLLSQNKKELLSRFENFEYHDDVDLDKKEDLQLNPKIIEQLKDIDDKIEILGKVCDKQYKNSYNMLKSILDKENEKVDNNIKTYISNLRNQLLQFKEKLNFDYKGKYKEVTKQLNEKVEILKKNENIRNKLEKKFEVLNEDCAFYERQLDNIKDMNTYLKYKLKMTIKNYNKFNNDNININDDNENIEPIKEEEKKKKIIKKNDDDFLITGLQEYELNEKSDENANENANENNNSNNKENLENKKFTKEHIDKVKKRFNYMAQKLYFDIENEKIEYSNLKEVFDKLYIKTNNIYMNILKNTHNEQKLNSSSGNNSNSNSNNQSTLPSIYLSTSTSKTNNVNKPKDGFMSKKISKEIIINFLEKEEIKKIIYKMLYDD